MQLTTSFPNNICRNCIIVQHDGRTNINSKIEKWRGIIAKHEAYLRRKGFNKLKKNVQHMFHHWPHYITCLF